MNTFQDLYDAAASMAKNSNTDTATFFKEQINSFEDTICSVYPWKFLEFTGTKTTTASTAAYELPIMKNNQVMSVRVTVGTEDYLPTIVDNYQFWEYLQSLETDESDVAQYVYIEDEKLTLYPTPASSSSTITVRGRKIHKDMTQADYSTGTIVSVSNGGTTVEGTGTPNWNGGLAIDANLHLRITKTAGDSGAVGDGQWYEVSSVTDDDTLELVKPYEGTSISSATAAYVIGEMPLIPRTHNKILLFGTLAMYYDQEGEKPTMADRYWRRYDGGFEAGLSPKIGGALKSMMSAYSGSQEAVSFDTLPRSERSLHDLEISDTVSGESW